MLLPLLPVRICPALAALLISRMIIALVMCALMCMHVVDGGGRSAGEKVVISPTSHFKYQLALNVRSNTLDIERGCFWQLHQERKRWWVNSDR